MAVQAKVEVDAVINEDRDFSTTWWMATTWRGDCSLE